VSTYAAAVRSLQAFADRDRLRILALIAGRPLTASEIAGELTIDVNAVTAHLTLLGRGGLIATSKERHERRVQLRPERLAELADWSATQLESGLGEVVPDESIPAAVRQFFQGRRLVSLPARRARYLEVLTVLAADFALDTGYPESEVNDILYQRHGDFATLRRDLVDFGFMTRSAGIYRRIK
jgi:hypothetical protein